MAVHLLDTMPRAKIRPSVVSYSAAISTRAVFHEYWQCVACQETEAEWCGVDWSRVEQSEVEYSRVE